MLEDLVTLHQNSEKPKVSVALPYDAPHHWLNVYKQFSDRQSPVDLAQLQRNSRLSLREFLDKNIQDARGKQESSKSVIEESKLLSDKICKELRLNKLESISGWSHASYHGSLKNFWNLCLSKKSELQNLKGHTIIFTDWTGVDPLGHVMLNTQDVPEFWLSVSQRSSSTTFMALWQQPPKLILLF